MRKRLMGFGVFAAVVLTVLVGLGLSTRTKPPSVNGADIQASVIDPDRQGKKSAGESDTLKADEIYYAIDGEAPITSKDDPRYARFMAGRAAIAAADEEAEKRADPAGYAKRKADDARWAAGLAAGRDPNDMLAEMNAEAEPLPAQSKAPPGRLTLSAYERLYDGMSPFEVWSLIPEGRCEEFVRSGKAVSYTCNDGGDGAMSVMFVDGELVSKGQNGLRR